MIPAHGAHVGVTVSSVDIHYSPLMEALEHQSGSIPMADITGVSLVAPTSVMSGRVVLEGPDIAIRFSPGQAQHAQQLVAAIEAARQGQSPDTTVNIPGLNFVAFDVETANADWGSICQMGAVKFVDGVATDSISWLVTPPPGLDEFDPDNVAIHGITAEVVAGAPGFPERLADFVTFVGSDALVAHNAQFDFTALHRACRASNIEPPTMYFGCSLLMARATDLGLENNKLPTVAKGLGVTLERHHDATADAEACGKITVALAARSEFSGSFPEFCFSRGFTLGILEPSRVYPVLRDRSGAGIALQRKKLGLGAAEPARASVEPEPTESPDKPARSAGRQSAPWARVATPEEIPDPNLDADPKGPLYGQHVTLTGDFAPFDKGDLWQRMADKGATVGKGVTKKTTILVCGPWATKTSKQKRAEELIDKGQKLALWDEKQLYGALGLDEQPPF